MNVRNVRKDRYCRIKNRYLQANFNENVKLQIQGKLKMWLMEQQKKISTDNHQSMAGGEEGMINDLSVYAKKMEDFYVKVAEVAGKRGYMLHLIKEEAYPISENGEKISEQELRGIWGDDIPSWKWYYDYFFEEREPADYDQIINDLTLRGYKFDYTNRYDFSLVDRRAVDVTMFSGEVVLKLDDEWFAIGECTDSSTLICKLYKPLFVIKNLRRLERKLGYRQMLKTMFMNCIDCGKRVHKNKVNYCTDCEKPVCADCIAYCFNCKKPLCKVCGYFGFCNDCKDVMQYQW